MNWPNWEEFNQMTRDEQVEELLNRNIIYDDDGVLRWTDDGSIYKEGA